MNPSNAELGTQSAEQQTMFEEHPDAIALRDLLSDGHWLSRHLIAVALQWNVRRVAAAAEKLGAEIVRSRTHGFKLVSLLTKEEIPVAIHAAEEMHSQAKKNESCALALKRAIHQRIG
jgi:hypothetical protein